MLLVLTIARMEGATASRAAAAGLHSQLAVGLLYERPRRLLLRWRHRLGRQDEQHIAKAKGELCRLCLEGVGCSAYAARPASCVGYNCLWRQCSGMGEELRPDRCGVIFDAGQPNTPVGVVRATLVDALKLEAADEEVGGWLRTLSRAGIPFVHDFAGSFVFSFRATDADAWAQSVLPDGRRATSFYQPIPDAIEETA